MMPIPFRDESNAGTHKRTYWPRGDAQDAFKGVKKKVASMTSKRGKPYSRADQQKIAREKWGAFCETSPEWRGG